MRAWIGVLCIALAALCLADYATYLAGVDHQGAAPPPSRAQQAPRVSPPARQSMPGHGTAPAVARKVSAPGTGGRRWVTAWGASPQAAPPGMLGASGASDQTVRDVVFMSAGGDAVRLVLTNVYGTSPLRAGHVTVGLAGAGAAIVAGSIRAVTFAGRASVLVPAGAQLVSDPVIMRVPALRDLAVSVYLPDPAGEPTIHLDARQDTWISSAGDHAAATSAAAFTTRSKSWFYLSDVIVSAYQPGASPQQLIAGYEQLIGLAHARGVRIFGATLLPFKGAGYYTAAREGTREAVNAWIRGSGAFDGVLDFDTIMADPADPLALRPAYDSGDGLHPSDAGYQAIAAAISLLMLRD